MIDVKVMVEFGFALLRRLASCIMPLMELVSGESRGQVVHVNVGVRHVTT